MSDSAAMLAAGLNVPASTVPAAGAVAASVGATEGMFRHLVFPDTMLPAPVRVAPTRLAPASGASAGARVWETAARRGLSREQRELVEALFAPAGLDARAYGDDTLRRRLPACLRRLGATDVRQALRIAADNSRLGHAALDVLVLGVSAFFRDAAVFHALDTRFLPELARGGRALRIWSAGCADGAELYSVAMLLDEMGRLEGHDLLGTDCRQTAVQRARQGTFDGAELAGVSPRRRARFFTREEDRWRAHGLIARASRWRRGNLLRMAEPGLWDMILCRNVSIYLRPEAALGLWRRLEEALHPGGLLVVGTAERPTGARRLSSAGACVYRRDRG